MHKLSSTSTIKIRFSETDAMGVVWHGNYIKFFEDGREAFGLEHNLEYLKIYNSGFFTPIVALYIKHTAPIYYGEEVAIETIYTPCKAAKIVFTYKVYNPKNKTVYATGTTTQVFLHIENRELELNNPAFFQAWKDIHLSSKEE